ncbi:MAG TPA: type IV pili twitching motility protein PilT [Lentisphaeria bacterium]|nr:MAG: type IV pili twitching motility protein PilT [Lentisphaerae bacterium GWF2_50_93]HCE44602.1 type IV pili twitching motility protein PilT [Lentisphaeria bacterium]
MAAAIDNLLEFLISSGASDLHLGSGLVPSVRVDGEMTKLDGTGMIDKDAARALIEEIMPEQNKKEFQECCDTDFAYELPGLGRFRVNVFMDKNGIGTVIRQIPAKILSADALNLPQAVRDFCFLNKGLVVVTGPTGSGKSTTLAAMIDLINEKRTDHIITIEDPVEFVHRNKNCLINHREVHSHTNSFKRALRAALREDPDIILVGEMRDLETVEIAIETAETGHLVFGTLHTNTAASTVDRIIDQFPAERQAQIRTMLSTSLKGVVAQTLLKKKTGGRVAALEILIVNSGIANIIRDGKTYQIPSMMQTGRKFGMQTLNDALFSFVEKGIVTPEEALYKSVDKPSFETMLSTAGYKP